MKNREDTYYSLLSSEYLRHIEQTADSLSPEAFVTLNFDRKWYGHLWIPENNECFVEMASHFEDLQKLNFFLSEQLKLYVRRIENKNTQEEAYLYNDFNARKDWLNHTIFISKKEFRKTKKEIFREVVKWCKDWQKNWLETFNPDNNIQNVKEFQRVKLKHHEISEDPLLGKMKGNPSFNQEYIDEILNILKPHFPNEQHDELARILQTGSDAKNILNFLGNGNRLADGFKQLKDADIITRCTKKELEKWILNKFSYRFRNEKKRYTAKYLNDIISTTKDKCQKPLINVFLDKDSGKYKITKA